MTSRKPTTVFLTHQNEIKIKDYVRFSLLYQWTFWGCLFLPQWNKAYSMRTYCIMSIISLLRSALCSPTTFRCFRDKCPSVSPGASSPTRYSISRHCTTVLQETKKITASCFAKGRKRNPNQNQQTSQPLFFHKALFECLMVSNVFIQQINKGVRCATAIQAGSWSTELFFGDKKLIRRKKRK